MFNIGDRVKHSGYALMSERDYWQGCGTEPRKSRLGDAYKAKCAERGTVTAILSGDSNRGVSPGIEVTWDSGSVSRCLTSRVEMARD